MTLRAFTRLSAVAALLVATGPTRAQPPQSQPAPDSAWVQCAATAAPAARLACYDQWAAGLSAALPLKPTAVPAASPVAPAVEATVGRIVCQDPRYSELSRFWELDDGSSCGTFGLRSYRPLSFALVGSNSVNRQPVSGSAGRSASAPVNYKQTETRLQLSMRTKLAQGLLTPSEGTPKDSLWFAYSQQSYWQLFSSDISRPFRTTDHEPELIYVYPLNVQLPGQGRLRYGGLGLVHQSNGQSLPLSRSWNRVYLMAGAHWDDRWLVQGRVWRRASESLANDDNPGIENTIGRAEVKLTWNPNPQHTFGMTWRHSLRADGNGSARLEWLRALSPPDDGGQRNLRLHMQIFSGYGDSLLDYNRQRTTYSLGLSLLDF